MVMVLYLLLITVILFITKEDFVFLVIVPEICKGLGNIISKFLSFLNYNGTS